MQKKVHELIAELSLLPQDADIVIEDQRCELGYSEGVDIELATWGQLANTLECTYFERDADTHVVILNGDNL